MLDERRGRRRVVLLVGLPTGEQQLSDQQRLFNVARAGMEERDIDVLVLPGSNLTDADRQFLRQPPFNLAPSDVFVGYLIGKDGTLKKTFRKPVAAEALFALIDSMPMRRQEMKRS
jgi:hypothetical protein